MLKVLAMFFSESEQKANPEAVINALKIYDETVQNAIGQKYIGDHITICLPEVLSTYSDDETVSLMLGIGSLI